MVSEKAKPVIIESRNGYEFLFIHGYTGSPSDFNGLGQELHQELGVGVRKILLPGHGTRIQDLDGLEYKDLLAFAEECLKEELGQGKRVVLVGFSFGGQLALSLAARYPVEAAVNFCTPFTLKWIFKLPIFALMAYLKKHWKKSLSAEEVKEREGSFYYGHMHSYGRKLMKLANADVRETAGRIKCPTLTVSAIGDRLCSIRGLAALQAVIGSPVKETSVFPKRRHNIFFSNSRQWAFREVRDFIIRQDIFKTGKKSPRDRVAAIVPAYNEGERIAGVLETLSRSAVLDEVLVVDDGSVDDTAGVVKRFPKVKYLRNETNRGKGYSMERGVSATDAQIIFFCDADLKGLTPQIVEEIVRPVLAREVDMFIGVRNNLLQKVWKFVALNSGERALRREVWEQLPAHYKQGWRIEVGLNGYVKRFGRGLGYKVFPYYQTTKEQKRGWAEGTIERWKLNVEVVIAHLRFVIFESRRINKLIS